MNRSDCEGEDVEEGFAPDWYINFKYFEDVNKEVGVDLFEHQFAAVVPLSKRWYISFRVLSM